MPLIYQNLRIETEWHSTESKLNTEPQLLKPHLQQEIRKISATVNNVKWPFLMTWSFS